MSLCFGDFELDQERRQLLGSGRPVPLEPKAYELLCLLVERRPRALSRAQIRDVVWPGVFISESTLSQAVNNVRQALDDDARRPRFVRTVHGFGYAFCGEARDSTDGQPRAGRETALEPESSPYPGLSAFTGADAALFFGRELEVTAVWEKIRRQKILAVIGPSGVGKTSFLQAGVIPNRPEGWGAVCATPGSSPVSSLAHALIPGLAGDAEAIQELLQGFEEVSLRGEPDRALSAVRRWRGTGDGALVVVDQLEELFTLNPPEVQGRFAQLLGRLPEADIHVLLCLRDDFLFRCSEHERLQPVFQDLTPLRSPSEEALRRALVEPAQQRGVDFEEDALVEEMVEVVRDERGALPLLAFAVSRLWDERDRERRLLTKEAYERIGGVAGALAHHAEATLSGLGPDHEDTVREIFRNLVTSEGTRAAQERGELLSVFGEGQDAAGAVLDTLVNARLLTEYESPDVETPVGSSSAPGVDEASGSGHRWIEVVHESLLRAWPRLVRWQAQNEEGAVLRDQLRQATRLWNDKGRPDELLWTGRTYREYALWREGYAGGLSTLEEAFAAAMTSLAGRRRRRRRALVTAGLATSLIVAAGALGLSLRAEQEALRLEAAQLLSLGRLRLDDRRSEALAYTIASLERADNEPARRFAVEVLWDGPTERVFGTKEYGNFTEFSPNGRWAATGSTTGAWLWSREGGAPRPLGPTSGSGVRAVHFSGDSRRVLVSDPVGRRWDDRGWPDDSVVHVFSVDDARLVRTIGDSLGIWWVKGDRLLSLADPPPESGSPLGVKLVRAWPLDGGDPQTLGHWDTRRGGLELIGSLDPAGQRFVEARNGVVAVRRLESPEAPPRVLGRHDGVLRARFEPTGRTVLSISENEIRLWPLDGQGPAAARTLRTPAIGATWGPPEPTLDPSGRFVPAMVRGPEQTDGGCWGCTWRLFDLEAPPGHEPGTIRKGFVQTYAFDPTGDWLLSPQYRYMSLWYVAGPRSRVIRFPGLSAGPVFSPDGRFAAAASQREIRLWPIPPEAGEGVRRLRVDPDSRIGFFLAFDRDGRFLVASGGGGNSLVMVPLPSGPARRLQAPATEISRAAISPDGRFVVAGYYDGAVAGSARLGVWDLQTGERRDLDARAPGENCGPGGAMEGMTWVSAFLPDGRLVSEGETGLRLWDLEAGTSERLRDCVAPYGPSLVPYGMAVIPDGRQVVSLAWTPSDAAGGTPSRLTVFDLETRTAREITTHGNRLRALALDPTGRILVTQGFNAALHAGPLTGEEPHLLAGNARIPSALDVSPDGKWIVSGDMFDGVIRLSPMPDLSRPSLHALPLEELLAKLRTHTNLRVVPDTGAEGGYRVEPGPFPGWANPPDW